MTIDSEKFGELWLRNIFSGRIWGVEQANISIWFGKKGEAPIKSLWFSSCDEVIEFINTCERTNIISYKNFKYTFNQCNVYHACATFTEQKRTQKTVDKVRCLWVDIDFKDINQEEAITQLGRLEGTPFDDNYWIIFSGNGIHLYWFLDEPVDLATWKELSNLLQKTLQEKKIVYDTSRTGDAASLMRLVGSWNVKNEVTAVEILQHTNEVLHKFVIINLCKKNFSLKKHTTKNAFTYDNADLLRTVNYTPSNAELIAEKCEVIKEFKETGLAGNEPAWRMALAIVRHCVDGEEIAHKWSAKDASYNEEETQRKLDDLEKRDIKPILCETLQQHGLCKNCPFKGKVKTPILLGLNLTKVEQEETKEIVDSKLEKRMRELSEAYPKEGWIVGVEGIYKIIDEIPVLICNVPIFIIDLINDDSSDATVITAILKIIRCKQSIVFRLPLKWLADDKRLIGEFNARRICPTNKNHLKKYFADYLNNIQHITPQTAVNSLGWQEESNFVYTKSGDGFEFDKETGCKTVQYVLDYKMVGYAKGYESKGSLDDWSKIAQKIADDRDLAPHFFSLLCSMGAPLLCFTAAKGFVVSLYGKSGTGKTLAHKFALSVWGNPEIAGCIGVYDTQRSRIGRMATAKNLPLRLDEATVLKPDHLSGLIYELVNGRGRSRATMDGSLSNTASEWQTVTLITTNRPLLENDMTIFSEAERCRLLEMEVTNDGKQDLFLEIGEEMCKHYGVAGKTIIAFIVSNKEKIIKKTVYYQNLFRKKVTEDKRFWVACGAIAFTALEIAKELKLFNYSVEALMQWFEEFLNSQTLVSKANIVDARGFSSYEELVHALRDSLQGTLLFYTSNNSGLHQSADVPNREILGRVIVESDKQRLYIQTPIFKSFLKKHFADSMKSVLKDFGIKPAETRRFCKDVIYCYELFL